MTKLEKAELVDHYTWLVSVCKLHTKFTKEDIKKNKQIWEILLDIKTKEKGKNLSPFFLAISYLISYDSHHAVYLTESEHSAVE